MAKFLGVIAILFVALLVIGSLNQPKTPADRQQRECGAEGRFDAYYMAKEFVKRRLKAPATADFGGFNDAGVSTSDLSNCEFTALGYVDAQNSFGAKLRTNYMVELKYLPNEDQWLATNVTLTP